MKSLQLYSQFFEHMMGKESLVKFIINEDIDNKWKENEVQVNEG